MFLTEDQTSAILLEAYGMGIPKEIVHALTKSKTEEIAKIKIAALMDESGSNITQTHLNKNTSFENRENEADEVITTFIQNALEIAEVEPWDMDELRNKATEIKDRRVEKESRVKVDWRSDSAFQNRVEPKFNEAFDRCGYQDPSDPDAIINRKVFCALMSGGIFLDFSMSYTEEHLYHLVVSVFPSWERKIYDAGMAVIDSRLILSLEPNEDDTYSGIWIEQKAENGIYELVIITGQVTPQGNRYTLIPEQEIS